MQSRVASGARSSSGPGQRSLQPVHSSGPTAAPPPAGDQHERRACSVASPLVPSVESRTTAPWRYAMPRWPAG